MPRRQLIAVLAASGFAIATYLALYQVRMVDHVWDPLFGAGSAAVLDSRVSQAMRRLTIVPDSALGALAYAIEFALTFRSRKWMLVAVAAGLAAAGVALIALQAFVIHAFCLLCLTSAAISVTTLPLAIADNAAP